MRTQSYTCPRYARICVCMRESSMLDNGHVRFYCILTVHDFIARRLWMGRNHSLCARNPHFLPFGMESFHSPCGDIIHILITKAHFNGPHSHLGFRDIVCHCSLTHRTFAAQMPPINPMNTVEWLPRFQSNQCGMCDESFLSRTTLLALACMHLHTQPPPPQF